MQGIVIAASTSLTIIANTFYGNKHSSIAFECTENVISSFFRSSLLMPVQVDSHLQHNQTQQFQRGVCLLRLTLCIFILCLLFHFYIKGFFCLHMCKGKSIFYLPISCKCCKFFPFSIYRLGCCSVNCTDSVYRCTHIFLAFAMLVLRKKCEAFILRWLAASS